MAQTGGEELRAIATYTSFATVPGDGYFDDRQLVVSYRFVSIPAVVVTGTGSAIEGLRADPALSAIEYDRELVYFLDTATTATRAIDVWETAWWPTNLDRVTPSPLVLTDGAPVDGRGITIGIVDSGVNALHPDLWYAPAFVEGMPWEPKVVACVNSPTVPVSQPYCDETVGHGTHVAGIAAGNGWAVRNGLTPLQPADKPYVGAAPGAKLAVAGAGAAILVIDASTSLDWMYANRDALGIKVVSNSWGDLNPPCSGSFPSGAVIATSNALVAAGVPVVFAAGNYFPSTSNPGQIDPTWTSTYARNPTPGVISVANYAETGAAGSQLGDRDGSVNGQSSDGCALPANAQDQIWTWPDVAAPGTSIASTAAYSGTVVAPAWDPPVYASASGTSMSAPHVAGVIALMLQANPDLTPAQVEEILIDTATPWGDGVAARTIGGTTMWGPAGTNNAVDGYADPTQCKINPTHAAKARAGDTSVDTTFPQFTTLAAVTDPDLFICRDFKRGRGLVDAYAAVEKALELRSGGGDGTPEITITSPSDGATVPAAPLTVDGLVDRLAGSTANELPTASLTATPTTGAAPLEVDFTASGSDTDGVIASWSLDFDDGSATAGGAGPLPSTLVSHTYTAEGTFDASLTVTDDDGATATAAVQISVGGVPVPDGTLTADVFAYNEGGIGASNVIASATTLLVNDDVPKYVAGETVSVEARQSVSTDAGVPIGPGTSVSLFIFDDEGTAVAGPLPMTGGTESGVFACTPPCYFYSAANVQIGDDWEGRYFLAPRATVGGTDYWFLDRAHDGLKKIDVIRVGDVPEPPGQEEPDDSAHDIADGDSDATTPFTEIQWADTALTSSTLTVVIKVQQAGTPAGDSPFLYGILVNGLNIEVYVLGGTGLWDNTNNQAVTGGTATIDPVTSTITAVIPRSYLASKGADCPCVGHVESRFGEGQLSGLIVDDRAPNAGDVELKASFQPSQIRKFRPGGPVLYGSEEDPETGDDRPDGAGPANAAWMDVQKLWVSSETPTTFDITMKMRDLAALPPSVDVLGLGGVATNYGAEFCTNNNAQTYTATAGDYIGVSGVVCYRLSAVSGALGPSFTGYVIQKDGSGACGRTPSIVDAAGSAFNIAADTITWRLVRAELKAATISDTVQTCNTAPPAWTGAGVVDGTVLTRLKGSTGHSAGLLLVATIGTLGDSTNPASARPYTFGLTAPLSVSAGGPYSGQESAPVSLAGVISGGTAPYACTWSGTGAVFSDPASCTSTSATFATAGDYTVTLAVTDGSSPAQSASADAGVTITAAPAGERVEIFVGAEATPRATIAVSTSTAEPQETWSAVVDLTGLSGSQTITAKWLDEGAVPLDEASVTVTVDAGGLTPFVEILEPADDPSGTTPLSGVIDVSGNAGHVGGGGGSPTGLNVHGMPIASGSRAGLRATVLEGAILATCAACEGGAPGGVLTPDDYLVGSFTWFNGPGNNGIDGFWFDVAGFGGASYSLDSEFDETMDIFFFNDWTDFASVGRNQGTAWPKTGTVPAAANYAFVYMRRPTAQNLDPVLDTAFLTLTPTVVAPSAPQALAAVGGPNQIALTWMAPANDGGEPPTVYKVYRDDALLTTLGAVLTYVDPGLTPGQSHTYEVTAVNSAGESVRSNAATAAALDPVASLAITNPADNAVDVPPTTTIDGTYTPRGGVTPTGTFANTHYFFLLNLNSPCGGNLGYGDHLISSKLRTHAIDVLGVPAANTHVFNEAGTALVRSIDASNYDQLPQEWKDGSVFQGQAKMSAFVPALNAAASSAAAGEAAGGPPARVFILQSSHGLWAPQGNHVFGSEMCLYPTESVLDRQFGDAITAALDSAEAANAGVSIETAILVDCSFCGGFADSPFWMPGTTTTAVDSARVVGPNRVVEVGCTWITECFGNPAVTYNHIFNRCMFLGNADGYGPVVDTNLQANPAPGGSGDPGEDIVVPDPNHHPADGVVTMEEAYWCSLDSVKGQVGGGADVIGIQQMFQLVDQMTTDLFTDEGFVLWDINADQDLGSKDPADPLALELPSVRASATDAEGDGAAPYLDLLALDAAATSTMVVLDLTVADLTLSSLEQEDLVEYNFFVNGDRIGVCYTNAEPTAYNYNLGPQGAYLDNAVIAYDFATGRVHVEIPLADLNDDTLPATLYAQSYTGRPCQIGGLVADDRIPNVGDISTSNLDDPPVETGTDQVRIRLDGPGGAVVNANALLDADAGTWTMDPAGELAGGTWTATAEHFFDPGTGSFASVDGPVSVTFSVATATDVTPPSQVLNLGGTPGMTTVALAWDAATDDVGVTGYGVYRGGASGFTPGPATLVASPAGTSYTDTGLVPDTTYYYRVDAFDAAGNRGPPSAEYAVTTLHGDPVAETVSLYLDDATTPFDVLAIDSSATGSAGWATTLDTAGLADGAHTIRADYDDGVGGVATDVVTFHAQVALAIEITSPAAGAEVAEDFTVSGTTAGTGGPEAPQAGSVINPDGTLIGDHFAVTAVDDPAFEALRAAFESDDGFVGIVPAIDGTRTIVVLFDGDAPADLHAELLPEGWTLDVHDHIAYEPMRILADRVVELEEPRDRDGPPVPSDSVGIGPGSTVLINFFDPVENGNFIGICTANFVWKDSVTGKVFLGTAGHCFMGETFTATHGPGANWALANTQRVRVCVETCIGGASGLVSGAVGLYPGVTRDLRNTAAGLNTFYYARQQGVGTDFGVVEIPQSLWSQIRTDLPVWSGPDVVSTTRNVQLGDVVLHYGNAIGMGEVFPTKARGGVGSGSNANNWLANTPSAQGDSGSGVVIAAPVGANDLVEGEWAAGLLTHLVVSTGFVAGTTGTRAKNMALTDAGLNLVLVSDPSELVTVSPPGAPTGLSATAGDGQVSLGWTAPPDGGSAITGYTVKYGTVAGGPYPNTQAAGGTSAIVTGLTNGQTYHFVVSATNAQGEGTNSAETSATPSATSTVPNAPTGLAALAGDGQVSLSWTAPPDGGSPITGYTVNYGTTAGGPYTGSHNSAGTSATVTGLTNGQEYFFVVTASNVNGEGPASSETSATPQGGVEPVYAVQLRASNTGGEVLPWTTASFYDGSSWSHDLAGMPAGALTVEARLVRNSVEIVATDEVSVTVVVTNFPPVASAGDDQSVEAGTLVTLSGLGSSDSDGDALTYAWAQIGGTAATLQGADTATPSFTAPRPSAGDSEILIFRLTVEDPDGETASDDVAVTTVILDSIAVTSLNGQPLQGGVEGPFANLVDVAGEAHLSGAGTEPANTAPVAAICPDPLINGLTVAADGTCSFDLDGTIVSYGWDMGDASTRSGPTVTHTYAASGTYTITLTVTDDRGAAAQTSFGPFSVIGVQPPGFSADAGDSSFVRLGDPVTLGGSATGGTAPLSYAWDTDGDDLADTPGQTIQVSTVGLAAGGLTFKLFVTDAGSVQAVDTVPVLLYATTDQVTTFQNHVVAGINDEDISGNTGLVDDATFRHDVTVNAGAESLRALLDWTRKAEVVPSNPVGFEGGPNDFDLYAISPDRAQDDSSADFSSPEEINVAGPGAGAWTFEVRSYLVVDDTYTLSVTVTSPPPNPVPVIRQLSPVCYTGSTQLLEVAAATATGSAVTGAWDLDLDGEFDDATGLTATANFAVDGGAHLVRFRATSADGYRSTILVALRVATECSAAASVVVIGVADTGINPYHREFEGRLVPYPELLALTTADEANLGPGDVVMKDASGNMLPFTRHPSSYIPGFPADAQAIELTLGAFNKNTDNAAVWNLGHAKIPLDTWFWIPGTKIVGAIDADDSGFALSAADATPIYDDAGHGTGASSVAAGNTFGSCPKCVLAFAEGASGDLDHLIDQKWIDFTSFSFGAAGNVGFPVISREEVTKRAAERGQTVSYAAGNGYENAFVTPEQTYTSNSLGPDWTVAVGAVAKTTNSAIAGTGKPVDWSSYGSGAISGACRTNYNGDCGFSGTSAATPLSTGYMATALLNARVAIGDASAGQKAPADAFGQRQAVAVGTPIPASPYLSDGVLQRAELWNVAFHCASLFGTSVGFPGNGPRSPVDYAYGGYGIADAAMAACASNALINGANVPQKPDADQFFDVDAAIRDALWGDWDGDGDGNVGGDHNGPGGLVAPSLKELRRSDVDTIPEATRLIADLVDQFELTMEPPAVTETYYLHRNGCGTGQDNTQYMDRTPKAAREAGHGCGNLGATRMSQGWTSTVPTAGSFGSGSTVTAVVRAFALRPHPGVVLTGVLKADGIPVGTGTSAPVDVVAVALVTTPCHEWVMAFPTTAAVAEGATLRLEVTSPDGTQDLPMCYEGGAGASRVSITGSAGGEVTVPTAEITQPAAGSTFDIQADSPVAVAGTATFPAEAVTQRLFLRRDNCANLNTDTMYLSPVDADDAGNGCALLAGGGAPVQDFVERYPLVGSELPLSLAQGGTVTGTLYFSTQGVDPAQVEVRIQSSAGLVGKQTLEVLAAEALGLPGPAEADFAIAVPNGLAGTELSSLTLEIKILRQGAVHWTELESPPSFVDVPREAVATGAFVQVAVDDPTFTSGGLTVVGTQSWSAPWILTGLGEGDHTIYARAGTSSVTGPLTSVVVTLEATVPTEGVVPTVEIQVVAAGGIAGEAGWTEVAYDGGTEAWDYAWDTFVLPNGDYDFHARLLGDGVEERRTAFTAGLHNVHPPALGALANVERTETDVITIPLAADDLDVEQLTFTATGLPAAATVVSTGLRTAELRWTPGFLDAGVYTVGIRVEDPDGNFDEGSFQLTILNLNRLPTIDPVLDQATNEDQLLQLTLTGSDPDTDDTLSFGITGLPDGATLDPATGAFSWRPTFDQAGTYALTAAVSDGKGGEASTGIFVTVLNVNRAPVLDPVGPKAIKANRLLSVTVAGADPDGEAVTFGAAGLPAGASFNPATRQFTWRPTADQVGLYVVSFSVTDGSLSDSEDVTIAVEVNLPPVVRINGPALMEAGVLAAFNADGTTDPDGSSPLITYAWDFDASDGFQVERTGKFVTRAYALGGTYVITLRATDQDGFSATGTHTVVVDDRILAGVVMPTASSFEDGVHYFEDPAQLIAPIPVTVQVTDERGVAVPAGSGTLELTYRGTSRGPLSAVTQSETFVIVDGTVELALRPRFVSPTGHAEEGAFAPGWYDFVVSVTAPSRPDATPGPETATVTGAIWIGPAPVGAA